MTKVIGLCGYAQTGKDEAAAALCSTGRWVRVSFADPIREMLLALDPYVVADKGLIRLANLVRRIGWDRAKQHSDVRRLLQRMGTEAGRDVLGDSVWVNRAVDRSQKMLNEGKSVVITDVRFRNEAEALRWLRGDVVGIERPGVSRVNNHVSDRNVDMISKDITLINDGTVEEWRKKVIEIFS